VGFHLIGSSPRSGSMRVDQRSDQSRGRVAIESQGAPNVNMIAARVVPQRPDDHGTIPDADLDTFAIGRNDERRAHGAGEVVIIVGHLGELPRDGIAAPPCFAVGAVGVKGDAPRSKQATK
jgi:hypothetical protein